MVNECTAFAVRDLGPESARAARIDVDATRLAVSSGTRVEYWGPSRGESDPECTPERASRGDPKRTANRLVSPQDTRFDFNDQMTFEMAQN